MLKEVKTYLQENLGTLAEEFLQERYPDIYAFLNNLEEYELEKEDRTLLKGYDYPYFFVVEILEDILNERCYKIELNDYEHPLVHIKSVSLNTYFQTGRRIVIDCDYYNSEAVLGAMREEYDRWISYKKNEGRIKVVSPACLK